MSTDRALGGVQAAKGGLAGWVLHSLRDALPGPLPPLHVDSTGAVAGWTLPAGGCHCVLALGLLEWLCGHPRVDGKQPCGVPYACTPVEARAVCVDHCWNGGRLLV